MYIVFILADGIRMCPPPKKICPGGVRNITLMVSAVLPTDFHVIYFIVVLIGLVLHNFYVGFS
jgi:hypothetical protein